MKKILFSLNKRIPQLIVIGAILGSCSETPEEMSSDDPLSTETSSDEEVNSLVPIDTTQVLAWNNARSQATEIVNFVTPLKNYFSIIAPDSTVDSIYVYIGLDTTDNTVSLFPIPSNMDTEGNLECLTPSKLDVGEMISLPVTVSIDTTREDHISLTNARDRINAWKNDGTRTDWIKANCNHSEGHLMGQIFVIKTVDMIPGDLHNCYLALDKNSEAVGGYSGDLIIVNTRTKKIIPPVVVVIDGELTGALEDVVQLGPPFKNIRTRQFGLLKTLGIE